MYLLEKDGRHKLSEDVQYIYTNINVCQNDSKYTLFSNETVLST